MTAIQWEGPITDPVGYATVAREFLLALEKLGAELYLSWGIQGWTNRENLDREYADLFKKINRKPINNIKSVAVHFRLPDSVKHGKNHVIMTLFETTRIPQQWTYCCNSCFTETWVPNEFNMQAFRESGVKNLHKIQYGVNIDRYNPNVEDLHLQGGFKFYSSFDFSYRKNPHGLLSAYFKEFDFSEDVVLYVKTWNIPVSQFKEYARKIQHQYHKEHMPKVVMIPNILRDNQMAQLYKSMDCFIMPSYGEGWSMPCIQSMACATPVIATNWGGQLEFMDTKNSYMIGVEKLIPSVVQPHLLYRDYMLWAQPNIRHLSHLMRYVFEHQKDARKRGLRARRDVEKFSWENAAKQMIKRVDELTR